MDLSKQPLLPAAKIAVGPQLSDKILSAASAFLGESPSSQSRISNKLHSGLGDTL